MRLALPLCLLLSFLTAAGASTLPVSVSPLQEFGGGDANTVGQVQLPNAFAVHAEVRVDASSQWNHVIEVGGAEWEFNAPFRLEVGDEGQWYVAVGDGASFAEAEIAGTWRYGDWVRVLFTYDGTTGHLYEANGLQAEYELLGSFNAGKDVTKAAGSLVLGSYAGTSRYFKGALRNVSLTPRLGSEPYQFGPTALDGQTTHVYGSYQLPYTFVLKARLTVSSSSRWNHVVELGGVANGYDAPFRLEVGDEGEWYVAFSTGVPGPRSHVGAEFEGSWSYGTPVDVAVLYDGFVCSVFEDGTLIGEMFVGGTGSWSQKINGAAKLQPVDGYRWAHGNLVVGSFGGRDRFFHGSIDNLSIASAWDDGLIPDSYEAVWYRAAPTTQKPLHQVSSSLEFSGQSDPWPNGRVGNYRVPSTFTISGQVRVDESSPYNYVVLLGETMRINKEGFFIAVGNEGTWLAGVGDGTQAKSATFEGSWTYGEWVPIHFTYDGSVARFYEDGTLLGEIVADLDLGSYPDRAPYLHFGSHHGTQSFFKGGVREFKITGDQVLPPR